MSQQAVEVRQPGLLAVWPQLSMLMQLRWLLAEAGEEEQLC